MPALNSPKAEIFAQYLARGIDYKEAYTKAGYAPSKSNSHALYSRPDVKERVSELIAIEANAQGITLESVVAELGSIAFLRAQDYFQWDSDGVRVMASETLTEKQLKAVVGVKETVRGIGKNREKCIEVKLGDKKGALETLLKHLAPKSETPDQHLHLHVESPIEQIRSRMAGIAARLGAGSGLAITDARGAGSPALGLDLLGPAQTIDAEPVGLSEPDTIVARRNP